MKLIKVIRYRNSNNEVQYYAETPYKNIYCFLFADNHLEKYDYVMHNFLETIEDKQYLIHIKEGHLIDFLELPISGSIDESLYDWKYYNEKNRKLTIIFFKAILRRMMNEKN